MVCMSLTLVLVLILSHSSTLLVTGVATTITGSADQLRCKAIESSWSSIKGQPLILGLLIITEVKMLYPLADGPFTGTETVTSRSLKRSNLAMISTNFMALVRTRRAYSCVVLFTYQAGTPMTWVGRWSLKRVLYTTWTFNMQQHMALWMSITLQEITTTWC